MKKQDISKKYPTIKKIQTPILIIGTGGAGLSAAIRLFEEGKKDMLLVGDCTFTHAHTEVAEGGINAAFGNMDSEPDTPLVHAMDTFLEGHNIAHPVIIETLGKYAPVAIKRLVKMGANFHKEKNGKISQRYFGAHTYRRTIFKGDETGVEIMRVLCKQVEKYKIPHIDNLYIYTLLVKKNKVFGALGIMKNTLVVITSPIVVLATGGYANLYSRSTQRKTEGYGDGIAMAYRSGAVIGDMEMVQFHPTGLIFPKEKAGELVTEAVRGEGGILTNIHGERFMKKYSPQKMELSTRDVVARSNYMEILAGRGTKRGGVYLDISFKDKAFLLERLPKMYRMLKKYNNIDIAKTPMEVAPTAHYVMGGLTVDPKTYQTTISNLYAIGECTMGVHGANRLGGNSLAEVLVFGDLLGIYLAKRKIPIIREAISDSLVLKSIPKDFGSMNPTHVIEKIQRILWQYAGIVRTEGRLKKGLSEIMSLRRVVEKSGFTRAKSLLENILFINRVQGMLDLAEVILRGALERRESRGAHYREDFLEKNDNKYLKNILFQKKTKKVSMTMRSVPKVSKKLQKALAAFEKTTNYGHVE